MIKISHDGSNVVVVVYHALATAGRGIRCLWNAQGEEQAAALAYVLHENLKRHIEAVAAEAYEKGWKAAKAKREKQRSGWRWWL